MDEEVILGRDEAGQTFKQFLSQYDGPAFIRRARAMQGAFDQLLDHCRRQRAEWLKMARLRIGMLHALAGEWGNLRPFLADVDQLDILRYLLAALASPLRPRRTDLFLPRPASSVARAAREPGTL